MTYIPYAPDDISTTPQHTGEWIDGKAVWRKIVKHSGTLTHNADNTVAHGVTGMTKLVGLYGTVLRDGGSTLPLNWHSRTSGTNFHLACWIDGANIVLSVGSSFTGGGNSLSDPWIIIEFLLD